jgi:hypothetical protein
MKESKIIDDLRAAVVASEQLSIFNDADQYSKVQEECIRFLRFRGFKIAEPKVFKTKIEKNDDLITFFYALLNSNFPGDYMTSCNWEKDRNIAKIFVDNRMEISGASREYVLNECGEIINTIFEHYDEFKFKYALSFSILGQKKSKWITDKAIQLMNKKLREKEEKETEMLQNEAIESQDTNNLGFNDLDDLLSKMEVR